MLCSEILLPPNASPFFADRQTLWNEVEKAERSKTAQLAYSFDVALQNEFSMQENIDLARQFLLEQFVSWGMVVDFSVHSPDKGNGDIANPHFPVMCPIRPLLPEGKWATSSGGNISWMKTGSASGMKQEIMCSTLFPPRTGAKRNAGTLAGTVGGNVQCSICRERAGMPHRPPQLRAPGRGAVTYENLEQFIQRVHKYEDLQEITPPYALRELVKGIYIEAPEKSSGKRRQGI